VKDDKSKYMCISVSPEYYNQLKLWAKTNKPELTFQGALLETLLSVVGDVGEASAEPLNDQESARPS
jgi:hypothetical protein